MTKKYLLPFIGYAIFNESAKTDLIYYAVETNFPIIRKTAGKILAV